MSKTRRKSILLRSTAFILALVVAFLSAPFALAAEEPAPQALEAAEASTPEAPASAAEAPAAEEPVSRLDLPPVDDGGIVLDEEQAPEAFDASLSRDIVLGVFYTSDSDYTDTIYASTNGTAFTKIAKAHDHNYNGHWGHSCPSIMYHNGYFWMISAWQRNDGKFWPMISYSKDLVHWTYPEGNGLITGTRGIAIADTPTNGNDIVAPEWYRSSKGEVYILFSMGYYGAFHGEPTKDRMEAYIVRVNELSASDGYPDGSSGYLWPRNFTFKTGSARRLAFSRGKNANYIDGAMYQEGTTAYLFIKKDGLTMQVYSTATPGDPDSYKLENGNIGALYGYEGMTVAKLGSTYYAYPDRVNGATADGVRVFTAGSITGSWTGQGKLVPPGSNGLRHGSVITLKAGTPAWTVAAGLLGYSSKWERLYGQNALGTMQQVVEKGFSSASTVVVATSASFKDALTASALAGKTSAPILLTSKGSLSAATRDEIWRLGATRAIIVGGTGAVSGKVAEQIKALGLSVERVAGKNAADTSRAVAKRVGGSSGWVVVATPKSFADALSIAPWAYANKAPIILTSAKGNLSDASLASIRQLGIKKALIVGGTKAVTAATETALEKAGLTVTRRGGANAIATSRLIAAWELGQGFALETVAVATSKGYKDALTGAALMGRLKGPLLLVSDGNRYAVDYLDGKMGQVRAAYVLGGEAAVSASTWEYCAGLK